MINFSRVLLVSPHPDDIELTSSAFILKNLHRIDEIKHVIFSNCDSSLDSSFKPGALILESINSNSFFGLSNNNDSIINYNFPVRQFLSYRQDILDILVKLNKSFKPTLVLVPSCYDTHQDHEIINLESRRAFKKTSLLGYETPWNNYSFSGHLICGFDEDVLKQKLKIISCFKSQSSKSYFSPNSVKSIGSSRALNINDSYAELFEVIRIIL